MKKLKINVKSSAENDSEQESWRKWVENYEVSTHLSGLVIISLLRSKTMTKTGGEGGGVKWHSRCFSKLKKKPALVAPLECRWGRKREKKPSLLVEDQSHHGSSQRKEEKSFTQLTWGKGWFGLGSQKAVFWFGFSSSRMSAGIPNISMENQILTKTAFHIEKRFYSAKKKRKTFGIHSSVCWLVLIALFYIPWYIFQWKKRSTDVWRIQAYSHSSHLPA